MSLNAIRWAWQQEVSCATERLVLLALADEADQHGGNCYPSLRYLASKCNLHHTSVVRAIKALELSQLIEVQRPQKAAPGKFNRYLLPLETGSTVHTVNGSGAHTVQEVTGALLVAQCKKTGSTVRTNPGKTHIPANDFENLDKNEDEPPPSWNFNRANISSAKELLGK